MKWCLRSGIALSLAALSWGCKVDGTVGGEMRVEGGSGGASTTDGAESDTETTGTSGGSGSAEGGGTGGAQTGTSGATGGTAAVDTMQIDPPEACVTTPDDTACTQCRKASCCEPLHACLGHEGCVCWWHCLAEHTHEQCEARCHTGFELFSELEHCTLDHCDDVCG